MYIQNSGAGKDATRLRPHAHATFADVGCDHLRGLSEDGSVLVANWRVGPFRLDVKDNSGRRR